MAVDLKKLNQELEERNRALKQEIEARIEEIFRFVLQEIYDLLGVERKDKDRIKNIAELGINTFGWSFMARSTEKPTSSSWRTSGSSGVR